jgi:multiple sugar transport system ATP-binding protein
MNFIEGQLDWPERVFRFDSSSLAIDATRLESLSQQKPDRVTLGIRPLDIEVSMSEQAGWVPATVYVTELMGNETFVFLRVGDHKIIARASAECRAQEEDRVWLKFDTVKAHFFDPTSGLRL